MGQADISRTYLVVITVILARRSGTSRSAIMTAILYVPYSVFQEKHHRGLRRSIPLVRSTVSKPHELWDEQSHSGIYKITDGEKPDYSSSLTTVAISKAKA